MRQITLLFAALFIATCLSFVFWHFFPSEPSNCDAVKRGDAWMQRHVTTSDEVQQEIDALIVDNKCDGITPAKLRKVLTDMERTK